MFSACASLANQSFHYRFVYLYLTGIDRPESVGGESKINLIYCLCFILFVILVHGYVEFKSALDLGSRDNVPPNVSNEIVGTRFTLVIVIGVMMFGAISVSIADKFHLLLWSIPRSYLLFVTFWEIVLPLYFILVSKKLRENMRATASKIITSFKMRRSTVAVDTAF